MAKQRREGGKSKRSKLTSFAGGKRAPTQLRVLILYLVGIKKFHFKNLAIFFGVGLDVTTRMQNSIREETSRNWSSLCKSQDFKIKDGSEIVQLNIYAINAKFTNDFTRPATRMTKSLLG